MAAFIRFQSPAGASFAMSRDSALAFLKMMGMSGNVPGALSADDIPGALDRLRQSVAGSAEEPVTDDDAQGGDRMPRVSVSARAYPLIELLNAAAKRKQHVMWEDSDTGL